MDRKKRCYLAWGLLYVLCVGLSFLQEPEGLVKALCIAAGLAFFVPPAMLAYRGERATFRLLRNLSALSLGLTLAVLVANFMAVQASETMGTVLYALLILVSAPMVGCQVWVLSLFLWACLLMLSLEKLRQEKHGKGKERSV